ncbi:MAG TPA: hypothetical protein VN887_16630 [Candidatus Angelobacter sp.]|nr:hypothetical protein [Candidatus Angelobacter sp.]
MSSTLAAILLLAVATQAAVAADPHEAAGTAVSSLMRDEVALNGIPFAEVLKAATGRTIIPFDSTNAVDRALLTRIGGALDKVLEQMNAPGSPAQKEKRINEVSAHFEKAIKDELNRIPGFECDWPKTASGKIQHSGYPDLRLLDKATGRVTYLDPKLYERGSRDSTFRTFYYEPKKETNKILDDAHHLIVGIEHDGEKKGQWKFLHWELVDLSRFRVRLKAEFQGSNRDMYRPEAIVGTSRE